MERFRDAAAVDQENIEQAIIVVVEQRDAARHRLDQEFSGGGRILKNEINAPEGLYFEKRRGGSHRREIQEITPGKSANHSCTSLLALARKANANCILRLGNSPIQGRKHGGFVARVGNDGTAGENHPRWMCFAQPPALSSLAATWDTLSHRIPGGNIESGKQSIDNPGRRHSDVRQVCCCPSTAE
jgi:hypothetical protein